VALTASVLEYAAEVCAAAGIDECIAKPLRADAIPQLWQAAAARQRDAAAA
jgi:hypothetical protein